MDLSTYQKKSKETAIYPKEIGIFYTTLGLSNEAGEVAGKIKKVFRDNNGIFDKTKKEEIKDELGDVLWYISQLATELDISLSKIAKSNLAKLYSRKKRGVLKGSGDNR